MTPEATEAACRIFCELGFEVCIHEIEDVKALEMAKLLETTYRAVMIAAFQEFHRICTENNVSLSEVVELLHDDDFHKFDKPVMYPWSDRRNLSYAQCRFAFEFFKLQSDLLLFVHKSNAQRKDELKVPAVVEEISKIRKQVKIDELRRKRVCFLLKEGSFDEQLLWLPEIEHE